MRRSDGEIFSLVAVNNEMVAYQLYLTIDTQMKEEKLEKYWGDGGTCKRNYNP